MDAPRPKPTDRQTEYHLILRPQGDGPPPWVRMRRLLKAALRTYGFKCMDIIEVPIDSPRISGVKD